MADDDAEAAIKPFARISASRSITAVSELPRRRAMAA